MLVIYNGLMRLSGPFLHHTLKKRCKAGKEEADRLSERMGKSTTARPKGRLVWFHAASVGEAQSMLILINRLTAAQKDMKVLVTTGTVTSAELMEKRLPKGAIHQYYPLDNPFWVRRFLDHWQPDLVMWMESEIWPSMLQALKKRGIPAVLVNARMSKRSFRRWQRAKGDFRKLLDSFALCLTQTDEDTELFHKLGIDRAQTVGNLKYSADKLPCNDRDLERLRAMLKLDDGKERPVWLYASTHEGEEELAARLHLHLKSRFKNLLTIIVPRHPERRDKIKAAIERYDLKCCLRGQSHHLPAVTDDIYVADTLGELGLFYRLSPIACIGRSFSNDGGGGHNPIEAAQLECTILHGQHIQNLAQIYKDMDEAGAALLLKDENDFHNRLEKLLADPEGLYAMQQKAANFIIEKAKVVDRIMEKMSPLLAKLREPRINQNFQQANRKEDKNVRKRA